MGGAIAKKGTFHYLYRVLPIGRVIAMVHANHRGGVFESSRWCIWIIAMEHRCHRDEVRMTSRWFYEKRLKILDKRTYHQKFMAKRRNTRMRTGHGTIKCRGTRRCIRNGAETGELWGIRVTVANPQCVDVKDMAENINDAMSLTDTDVIAAWRALEGESNHLKSPLTSPLSFHKEWTSVVLSKQRGTLYTIVTPGKLSAINNGPSSNF